MFNNVDVQRHTKDNSLAVHNLASIYWVPVSMYFISFLVTHETQIPSRALQFTTLFYYLLDFYLTFYSL